APEKKLSCRSSPIKAKSDLRYPRNLQLVCFPYGIISLGREKNAGERKRNRNFIYFILRIYRLVIDSASLIFRTPSVLSFGNEKSSNALIRSLPQFDYPTGVERRMQQTADAICHRQEGDLGGANFYYGRPVSIRRW